MNIHQVSVIYVDEQDRILVRFNTTEAEELRLWLTRRMVSRVLEPLQDAVAQLEARKVPLPDDSAHTRRMLAELKRVEAVQQADFTTPYQANAAKLPLGSKPLVVTQLRMTVPSDHQLQIGFDEKLADQAEVRGFQVVMEPPMVHGFMHLLEAALAKAQWDIPTKPGRDLAGAHDELLLEETRPKYLQ